MNEEQLKAIVVALVRQTQGLDSYWQAESSTASVTLIDRKAFDGIEQYGLDAVTLANGTVALTLVEGTTTEKETEEDE